MDEEYKSALTDDYKKRYEELLREWSRQEMEIDRLQGEGAFSLARNAEDLNPVLYALQAGAISVSKARECIRQWLSGNYNYYLPEGFVIGRPEEEYHEEKETSP